MKHHKLILSLLSILAGFVAAPTIHAAGTAADADKSRDQGYMMMDHSPADTKAMSRMKDKKIPVHHKGDAPTASGDGTTEHIMMDHSPADTKAMSRMKDKRVPVHHKGDAPTASGDGTTEHIMMDHSPADTKAMSRMKNHAVPVHITRTTGVSGNAGKRAAHNARSSSSSSK